MNFDSVKTLVTNKTARQVLLAQKHSPKILFVAGVVGVIGTTVLACRATLRVGDILDNYEIDAKLILNDPKYDFDGDPEQVKALKKLKVKTALEITKGYLPAVGVGVVSIAALTGSHVVLTRRNTALMAAYAGIDRAYKEYRQRVANEFGEDTDRKFALGSETVLVEEKTADGKTKVTEKVEKNKQGVFGGSPYAVVFDERSKLFSKEPGRNAMTLQMRQSQANDKLRAQGHLFLNEVYDLLDLPRSKAGAMVGWVWRRETEEKTGDNFVDFGIYTGPDKELIEDFFDGHYYYATIDPNVDGVILDLI